MPIDQESDSNEFLHVLDDLDPDVNFMPEYDSNYMDECQLNAFLSSNPERLASLSLFFLNIRSLASKLDM